MAALPSGAWTDDPPRVDRSFGSVRHVFTHFSLDLAVVPRSDPLGEGWWHPLETLDAAGLPTLYRRAAEVALGMRSTARAAA
jgi:A/G-specific adenine glycosylase